ncbi:flavodoxin family protein [Methanobacterium formicicum]|uniref:NADPH-dependent FMN reductase n=1 Tax=Methanobacterium formicicum (strain DSM 3637 / PP1) TaxID=1204725 RepID=K2QAK9_METFP|nr:flavodoxin family protein [Methanobacterium formicicum]EKF84991.1 NADPH-dependent FMN reductase [Methanobacterium formicicum DSM 3637]
MKVIGFTGSPRSESNTEILVEEMLKGSSDTGAQTKIFNLTDMNIVPCKACMHCKVNEGVCATDDDMQEIYKELKEADAFIVGSPLYFGEMSAQTKPFIDRLFAFYIPDSEVNSKKNMAFVFSQGNPDEDTFSEYYNYMKTIFEMAYNVVDVLVSCGNQLPGDVKNKTDVLENARNIGKKIVESN